MIMPKPLACGSGWTNVSQRNPKEEREVVKETGRENIVSSRKLNSEREI